jgi:hypothetical protein
MSTKGTNTRNDISTDRLDNHINDLLATKNSTNTEDFRISDRKTLTNVHHIESNISLIDCHPPVGSGTYPFATHQSPSSPPMVIQITDDEDDDSLAPLSNNKISLLDHEPIIIHSFDQQSLNITSTHNNNSDSAATTTTTTWIDRYFNFMVHPTTSTNNVPNMSTNSANHYSSVNEKNSSKSEVLYAMLVATVVALGAVFYSAWITAPHTSVVASSSSSPGANSNDDNSSNTITISPNNSETTCEYMNSTKSMVSSIQSIFTALATGFIASIIAVTFFSKMKISLTFDSSHQYVDSSETKENGNNNHSIKNATKSRQDIQESLLRSFHAMIAAAIVSILTYIVMNYNHTIFGKIITALYLLFLGM